MGRCGYSQVGYGFTVEEARRDAIASAEEEYGHQEGYSGAMNCSTQDNKPKCLEKPVVSKTCKVEKNVQKGARKWETVFIVEPAWGESWQDRRVLRTTQGKAIAEAKRLAIANQKEYIVTIDKQLVTGTQEIAKIAPKKAKRGRWLFTGEARC
jgi:hypothetical protein